MRDLLYQTDYPWEEFPPIHALGRSPSQTTLPATTEIGLSLHEDHRWNTYSLSTRKYSRLERCRGALLVERLYSLRLPSSGLPPLRLLPSRLEPRLRPSRLLVSL